MLKVAAAVSEIRAISSILRDRFGIANAAMATMSPSTRYLIALFTSSPKSIPEFIICIIKKKKGKYCLIVYKQLLRK